MKKYNKVITVEVSVDSIAEHLLSVIQPDFKHAELLIDSIITPAVENGSIRHIFNTLHGYNGNIDFQVGEKIYCKKEIYTWVRNNDETIKRGSRIIGPCIVIEVNPFSDKTLTVEYDDIDDKGQPIKSEGHVSHTSCDRKPTSVSK